MLLKADADLLKAMGSGNNVAGHVFTVDGRPVQDPSAGDHFPDKQTNVVPLYVSMGAYNCLQQMDCHAYWEFSYLGTNWVHPLYELPFTGGFTDDFGQAPDAFRGGEIGRLQSIVPGSGPAGIITKRRRSATIRTCSATPTSSTAISIRNGNSASARSRAASRRRSCSMSTSGARFVRAA
jgi:hypothetical protein